MARADITLKATAADLEGAAGRPTSGLMAIFRVACQSSVRQSFDTSSSPDGVKWQPLTIERARGGNKPLQDTGLLMASVVAQGQGHVETLTDTQLVLGTNRPGAALHQFGGTVRPVKGKYLAIPRTKEAARQHGPRSFPRRLFAIFGTRGGVLVERKTAGKAKSQEVVHYWLVKQVVIPARPFLGFGQKLLATLSRLAADWLAGGKPGKGGA